MSLRLRHDEYGQYRTLGSHCDGRKDLAQWDTSARSWMSIADKVKEADHQKIEGILQGISFPVDKSQDVYLSVMRAWNTAMSTMSSVIQAMPHRVTARCWLQCRLGTFTPKLACLATRRSGHTMVISLFNQAVF